MEKLKSFFKEHTKAAWSIVSAVLVVAIVATSVTVYVKQNKAEEVPVAAETTTEATQTTEAQEDETTAESTEAPAETETTSEVTTTKTETKPSPSKPKPTKPSKPEPTKPSKPEPTKPRPKPTKPAEPDSTKPTPKPTEPATKPVNPDIPVKPDISLELQSDKDTMARWEQAKREGWKTHISKNGVGLIYESPDGDFRKNVTVCRKCGKPTGNGTNGTCQPVWSTGNCIICGHPKTAGHCHHCTF